MLPDARGPEGHVAATGYPFQSPGALHVHSTFSWDAHGEVDAIAAAARSVGLEWIAMTDHDTLGARYAGFEGVRQGVHVVVGYEWSPPQGDHALMYGDTEQIPEPLPNRLAPTEAIRIVTARGGMTFVAHPDERRSAVGRYPPLPWHDWSIRGFSGIELWNYMSEWVERLTARNALHHAIRPGSRIQGPTPRTLAWWDDLNRPLAGGAFKGGARLTVGVSGVDAHGEGIRVLGRRITVFSYRRVFRTFINVLLLAAPLPTEAASARAAILAAIRDGRLYFADRSRGDPLGARFEANLPDGRLAIGARATLRPDEPVELHAHLPIGADIRLLRDGEEVATGRGTQLRQRVTLPGAYRLEAYRMSHPWLFTNPIVLAPA